MPHFCVTVFLADLLAECIDRKFQQNLNHTQTNVIFQENNHSIVVELHHNATGLAAGRPGETEHRLHHGR